MKGILTAIILLSATILQGLEIQDPTPEVRFSIRNAGVMVEGSFGPVTGTLRFNPEQLYKSDIQASVEAETVHTGIGKRDGHLRQEEYFNVPDFPQISMKSRFFGKGQKENEYRGYFNLTLKGTTREVTIPFTATPEGDYYRLKGSFTLNRLDYGVGKSSLILDKEVNITLNVLSNAL